MPMNFAYGKAGSNWLTEVNGNGLSRDYVYDANGNMTADGDYVTGVEYDIFNMPIETSTTTATAYHSYDVNGQRVYRSVSSDVRYFVRGADGSTLAVYDGSGDLQYWNILGADALVGRAVKGTSSTDRQYYVKDHLGSIRVTVNDSGTQDHQGDYYPFGLEMPGRVTTTDAPRERYTGHEIEELGSNTTWYYAGARMYDPVVVQNDIIDVVQNPLETKAVRDMRHLPDGTRMNGLPPVVGDQDDRLVGVGESGRHDRRLQDGLPVLRLQRTRPGGGDAYVYSIRFDPKTNSRYCFEPGDVIHIGGPGFKYCSGSGDLP